MGRPVVAGRPSRTEWCFIAAGRYSLPSSVVSGVVAGVVVAVAAVTTAGVLLVARVAAVATDRRAVERLDVHVGAAVATVTAVTAIGLATVATGGIPTVPAVFAGPAVVTVATVCVGVPAV